ncbi:MAG: CRTAC1 family protein [Verrucomicrobiota bacterium]
MKKTLFATALILINALSVSAENTTLPAASLAILQERQQLDQTVWAPEVEAQEYEQVFVKFWDQLREKDSTAKFSILAEFPFANTLSFGTPGPTEALENGVTLRKFSPNPTQNFTPTEWQPFVRTLEQSGIAITQTEWHHSRFIPATKSQGPQSTISFEIHAEEPATKSTFALKGKLKVQWSSDSKTKPTIDSLIVPELKLQERGDHGLFLEVINDRPGPGAVGSSFPILVYDLNHDGRSEIILPRWNRVYWNLRNRKFEQKPFVTHPLEIYETGILSDFDNDGFADYITVAKDGKPYFYRGSTDGTFTDEPQVCANVHFDFPTTITAGDTDGDGDLDLWFGQYKSPYLDGQMPTPFYDANDGYPSYYLVNQGNAQFTDATEESGFTKYRHRRTYSASFIDLDEDGDLDLVNISDFSGLDLYKNKGDGTFQLATDSTIDQRHSFGMGHTFGDYNQDGLLDLYVIGMSSTTARRLERLNLGREDKPDIHRMRMAMGYGNRLYFGNKEGRFREDPKIGPAVARTGWSWGTTSFDLDLDGDLDIYVANGHRSGESCQDYCSTFWRHDIYTGDSSHRPEVLKVFESTLIELNTQDISWNGYEKNVLLTNQSNKEERFINSAALFGAARSFDARCVISDDLDGDGRPDLIVGESIYHGPRIASALHVLANLIDTGENKRSFKVQLRESPGPGFSPNGAKVVITDNLGNKQSRWIVSGDSYLSQHNPAAQFGLGQATSVQSVAVTWPGGITETFPLNNAVNSTIILQGGQSRR